MHFYKLLKKLESKFGANPYTQQYGPCGTPGRSIHLSLDFVTHTEVYETAKTLLKEWAKFRYGVFDEYGFLGDSAYPSFYEDTQKNNKSYHRNLLTSCSYDKLGRKLDFLDDYPTNSCYLSYVDLNSPKSPKCDYDLKTHLLESSVMFGAKFINSIKFCDHQTHDPFMLTKQNALCNEKPVWSVLQNHPDFM